MSGRDAHVDAQGGSVACDRGLVVDPFAGPGGWSEALRMIGLADVGIEMDEWACRTRRAAGYLTIRADVAAYPAERFAGAPGVVMSPPCPDFSAAGKKLGRSGPSGRLIETVPVWIRAIKPQWFALEQVPEALPIWQEFAEGFEREGYFVWTGILNAADYGVCQARRRAVALGARWPVGPPTPTHAQHPATDIFGHCPERWVSMADGIGWGLTDRPAYTFCGGSGGGGLDLAGGSGARNEIKRAIREGRWVVDRRTNSKAAGHRQGAPMVPTVVVPMDRPSPTLTGKAIGQWRLHPEGRPETYMKLTVADALAIQSFRPGYPVQGPKGVAGQQIGNAVPPLLGAHVLAAVTGRAIDPQEVAA